MAKPEDQYNAQLNVAPTTSSGNDTINVRANANSFGQQVGGAVQNLGSTFDKLGDEATNIAVQRQGQINETLATNADSQYAEATGTIYGGYKALKGLDAVAARDPTVNSLLSTRQKIRDNLPSDAVRRAFDLMAVRREGYMVQDINGYAAGQIKAAHSSSLVASAGLALDSTSSPEVAMNPSAFGSALGDMKAQLAGAFTSDSGYASVTHLDLKTGAVTFDDTPDGNDAKAQWNSYYNKYLGKAWENKLDVLAFDPVHGNVTSAVHELEANRGSIPADAYARVAAKLTGPYNAALTRDGANGVLSGYESRYNTETGATPTSPAQKGSYSPEDFNKDAKGTLQNIFGGSTVTITSAGRTPEHNIQVGGSPTSEHTTYNAWDFNVANVPTKDAAVALAQRLGREGVKFDQIIDEGTHVHVGFGPKDRGEVLSGKPGSFTNLNVPTLKPVDSPVGPVNYTPKADWYESNYGQISIDLRAKAEQMFPDKPQLADQMYNNGISKVQDIIRTQRVSNRADQDSLLQGVDGKYTNGHPVTDASQFELIPELRDTWHRFQLDNPLGAHQFETKIIPSMSRGNANTYGSDFWKYYSGVMTGKITDPTEIMSAVNPNVPTKDSPVTNTGFKALKQLMDLQNTPDGKAFATAEYNWFNSPQVKGAITATGTIPGAHTPEGDDKLHQFMMDVLPKIDAGKARGLTAGQMFNPKSSDYVGGSLDHYAMTQADRLKIIQRNAMRGLNNPAATPAQQFNPATIKSTEDLVNAARSGHVTKEQYNAIALQHGWLKPTVPLEH